MVVLDADIIEVFQNLLRTGVLLDDSVAIETHHVGSIECGGEFECRVQTFLDGSLHLLRGHEYRKVNALASVMLLVFLR